MKSTSRFILMSITVLMTLILSAVMTVPALADDSVPPPADLPAEVVTPPEPVGDSLPADSAPVVDSPSADSAPAADSTAADSTPVVDSTPADSAPVVDSTPATEPSTLPELLAQLPEGTDVIVTNAAGDTLPLVTEEAAQTIASGDPVWCPVGVAPQNGTGGCSPRFTSFTNDTNPDLGLIAWLNDSANATTVSKAGVIWVAYNYNPAGGETGPIYINGDNTAPPGTFVAGTMETFALTIQGGWSGIYGSMLLNTTTPYSTFSVPLSITGWTGAVTIKNITIDGASVAPTTGNYALNVDTTGNILLDGVTVINSAAANMTGAVLDNTISGTGTGIGTVTVNNSAFNGNNGGGLAISSDSTVTTNNLTANGNINGDGVTINNASNKTLTPDKAVTMKGFKQFNGNGGNGLTIVSNGAITLSNITANYNGGTGVSINNTGSKTNLGVAISGTNYFMNNDADLSGAGDGLKILSNGAITLSNLNASYNGGNGVVLDNCTTSISKPVCVAKTVTITGINTFDWNNLDGLNVLSFGAILVNNLNANNNVTGNGVVLDNRESAGNLGVSVLGTNYFINNGDIGLKVLSHGVILANNLNASENTGDGAFLDNCGAPTTCIGVTVAKPVTITGINTFNSNQVGLKIYSFGTITLNNVTASNNTKQGALLHNDTKYTVPATVYSVGTLALNGYGIFNFNTGNGLQAFSNGSMILNNLTANFDTSSSGVNLQAEKPGTGAASVTLKGYNTFENNWTTGLTISADGAISISYLTATSNGQSGTGFGASLENWDKATSPMGVTLTGFVRVSDNTDQGLYIDSRGAVSLSNVTANNNGNGVVPVDGVYIKNDYNTIPVPPAVAVPSPQNVTLLGTNTFTINGLNGLYVESYGIITVWNSAASQNGAAGLSLNNCGSTPGTCSAMAAKPVYLYGYARANDNVKEGIYINTLGAVILTNVYADNNGGTTLDGVYVKNNYNPASPQNVDIKGSNTFTNNGGNGLYVLTYGAITASNLNASWNGKDGAHLDNSTATTAKTITLSGRNSFFMNGEDGLDFNAKGAVSLSNVDASLNTGKGISGTSTGAMTFACIHAYGNTGAGYALNINAVTGAITIKGLSVFGNGALNTTTLNTITPITPVITVNLLCP